jgi:hypothetical protein
MSSFFAVEEKGFLFGQTHFLENSRRTKFESFSLPLPLTTCFRFLHTSPQFGLFFYNMSRWKFFCLFRVDFFVSSCGVKAPHHFRRFVATEQGLNTLTLLLSTTESWLAPNALSALPPNLFCFTSSLPRPPPSTSLLIPLRDPHHYN